MKHNRLRRAVVDTARSFAPNGLGIGTSGNASVRIAGGFLITPSAVAYESMRARDIVAMDSRGQAAAGNPAPSTEWRFHRDIYRTRPEAGAVVHVHPPNATALACVRRGIPAFHYMVAVAGGDSIRCAKYATVGSAALSRNALAALKDRRACLLANHGLIALGPDLAAALGMALEIEELARQFILALQAGGPKLLARAEMRRVLEIFSTYGRRPGG
jgi:L-fuculose-phosphate aldolase